MRQIDSATVQVVFQEHDLIGRPTIQKKWRATSFNIDPTSMTTNLDFDGLKTTASSKPIFVSSTYDLGGVGDSHITSTRSYYSASDYIERIYKRTFRGQLRGMDQKNNTTSFGPYHAQDIDWLGRVIASARYTSAPSWPSDYSNFVHDPTANSGAGGPTGSGYNDTAITKYDDLGRVYRTLRFPGTQSANRFEVNNYYDRNGRLMASGDKYGAPMEYAYDGAGRRYQSRTVKQLSSTTPYSSGAFLYVAPTPNPSFSAMSGGDGGVIEMSHTGFDAAGNATEEHTVEVNHYDTDGFSLSTGGTPSGGIRVTMHNYFDVADRLMTSANYGAADHNDGATVWLAAGLPDRDTGTPTTFTSSANRLVTQYSYESDTGRLSIVTDAAGKKSRTLYDRLGRRTYLAENYNNFDGTLSKIGDDTNIPDASVDRVTAWEYNGLDEITKLTAYNGNSTTTQVTEYKYTDANDSSLVSLTKYPDGNTDTSGSNQDNVQMSYNLDGTLATRKDQRGVVLTYTYDNARRLLREGDDYSRRRRRPRQIDCSHVRHDGAARDNQFLPERRRHGHGPQSDQAHLRIARPCHQDGAEPRERRRHGHAQRRVRLRRCGHQQRVHEQPAAQDGHVSERPQSPFHLRLGQ